MKEKFQRDSVMNGENMQFESWIKCESDLCVGFYDFSAICDIYNVSVKKNVVTCLVSECVERNVMNV